jgi:hypothetical protein
VGFQYFEGGEFSLQGRSTFSFLSCSEDFVHHILIVLGQGGVHVLDLVGWEGEEGIGVGVVGIETSKDTAFR